MECDPGRIGRADYGAFAVRPVIAFDALFGVVAGFALLDDEASAADATVARVKHIQVIRHAIEDRSPRSGIGASAIAHEWNVNSVLGMRRRNSGGRRRHYRHAESKLAETHGCFSPIFAPAPSQRARLSTGQSAGAGIGVKRAPPLLEPQDLLELSYGTARGRASAVCGRQIRKPAAICSSPAHRRAADLSRHSRGGGWAGSEKRIEEIAAWEHDRNANHAKANWQFPSI